MKKTREHIASVIEEIKAEVKGNVIRDCEILGLVDANAAGGMEFMVHLLLSDEFDYHSAVLENWRRRLEADYYVVGVLINKLTIRFYVRDSNNMPEP